MAATKNTPASAAVATRGFADRIAPAMRALITAGNAHAKSGGTLQTRMTEAFVSVLAADHGLTPGDASKLVAERLDHAKVAGVPSTLRTWNKAFFDDARNLNTLRRSIASPEAMTPADYQAAVVAYAAKINARKAYEDAAKAKRAADKASADALKAEQARQAARDTDAAAESGSTVEPVAPTAVAVQGQISALLETLATLEGAEAALTTLQGQIAALLQPANADAPQSIAA